MKCFKVIILVLVPSAVTNMQKYRDAERAKIAYLGLAVQSEDGQSEVGRACLLLSGDDPRVH